MDMCEVHRTELFRKYPFQYWETEKYAPEQLNFYQIALDGYKLRWREDKLYICEYLSDGQTKDNTFLKTNPIGFAMMYNQNILFAESLKEKCINAVRMTALAFYAGNYGYFFKCNSKLVAILTLTIGIALFFRRRRQFKKLT